MKHTARKLGVTVEHLHGYFIIIAQHPGDHETAIAIMTGRLRSDTQPIRRAA